MLFSKYYGHYSLFVLAQLLAKMFGGELVILLTIWSVLPTVFFSIISIMSVSIKVCKITAQVNKTATFTTQDSDFGVYHVTILILFI